MFALVGCFLLLIDSPKPELLNVWPDLPPGPAVQLPPEADMTKPNEGKVAGQPVIRLGNVSTPTLEVFRPAEGSPKTGAAVVICPGGGHRILAYDLEGTEVAQWLAKQGITAFVLKYRVPARDPEKKYLAAVQDAQRALSIVRSKTVMEKFNLDESKIGILGFSAGGETAARAALMPRQYKELDGIDAAPCKANFALLIYPAYLVDPKTNQLFADIPVTKDAPPTFLAHAHDDPVTPLSSALLYVALKQQKVTAELHIYATGGHGYGLRKTDKPVTQWPTHAEEFLNLILAPKK
jgi:acetyl esterase/lipase